MKHEQSLELGKRLEDLQARFSGTEDLCVRVFRLRAKECALVYLETMTSPELVQAFAVKPASEASSSSLDDLFGPLHADRTADLARVDKALLEGSCAILEDGSDTVYLIQAVVAQARSIEEAKGEQVTRGPHDGFIEPISANIRLIRNRIRSPKLKVRYLTLGKLTQTKVAMLYLDEVAAPYIVDACERRLSGIELNSLYSTGEIEEIVDENPLSPFPQTLQTERPDRTVSYLMEGKVAILVDGYPSALILPITFFSFYQSPDDYNNRWVIGTFNRVVRMISFVLAISLPAIYIAIVSFHSEVLPMGILYSVKVAITYVPFPPIMEAITMQVILELLKEAAIRLHSSVAQTIGIVGGLVIGTAIVEAHLVSHTMIVIIGLTAISSFVTPLSEFGTSLRILGFSTIIAAAMFGFFGLSIMLMFIFIHLCKLEIMGVPYFSPFDPFRASSGPRDAFFRLPRFGFAEKWNMGHRRRGAQDDRL
ncbi:spore germination protein [Paenibacillus soyae]|uniref:Spore germination protein n=1 Tax=Paenibacillus soyae TaxID=2969249 RepID=A0A9X2MPJ7_9BACL|nr:spore germination protein [Paenibacillus soyae]MCR2803493.1 spore germination protein [Paenibacillus soyae]